ncbi:MAG: hypothetical protein FWH48_03715, partial [Oscillospiraceae bacterium]|nr:hypothetical protein [Oscillospiraceae bacterium]
FAAMLHRFVEAAAKAANLGGDLADDTEYAEPEVDFHKDDSALEELERILDGEGEGADQID